MERRIPTLDEFINEAIAVNETVIASTDLKVGEIATDYNDTEVKVTNIMKRNDAIAELQQHGWTKQDIDDIDMDGATDSTMFYVTVCTKANKDTGIKKGEYGIYPVQGDIGMYWELYRKK